MYVAAGRLPGNRDSLEAQLIPAAAACVCARCVSCPLPSSNLNDRAAAATAEILLLFFHFSESKVSNMTCMYRETQSS